MNGAQLAHLVLTPTSKKQLQLPSLHRAMLGSSRNDTASESTHFFVSHPNRTKTRLGWGTQILTLAEFANTSGPTR
jgi:hypothetical protein